MNRRAFFAVIFCSVAARALPKPYIAPAIPHIDDIVMGCSILIDPRQSKARLDFLGDAKYWLNKPVEWLPPDGTRS